MEDMSEVGIDESMDFILDDIDTSSIWSPLSSFSDNMQDISSTPQSSTEYNIHSSSSSSSSVASVQSQNTPISFEHSHSFEYNEIFPPPPAISDSYTPWSPYECTHQEDVGIDKNGQYHETLKEYNAERRTNEWISILISILQSCYMFDEHNQRVAVANLRCVCKEFRYRLHTEGLWEQQATFVTLSNFIDKEQKQVNRCSRKVTSIPVVMSKLVVEKDMMREMGMLIKVLQFVSESRKREGITDHHTLTEPWWVDFSSLKIIDISLLENYNPSESRHDGTTLMRQEALLNSISLSGLFVHIEYPRGYTKTVADLHCERERLNDSTIFKHMTLRFHINDQQHRFNSMHNLLFSGDVMTDSSLLMRSLFAMISIGDNGLLRYVFWGYQDAIGFIKTKYQSNSATNTPKKASKRTRPVEKPKSSWTAITNKNLLYCDVNGMTLLCHAIICGNEEAVQILLEAGADPDLAAPETPKQTQSKTLHNIYKYHNRMNATVPPLNGTTDQPQQKGALKSTCLVTDGGYRDRPIFVALRAKTYRNIMGLLEHGCDINATSVITGYTLLYESIAVRAMDIAKYLLQHGADPTIGKSTNDINMFDLISPNAAFLALTSPDVPKDLCREVFANAPENMKSVPNVFGYDLNQLYDSLRHFVV